MIPQVAEQYYFTLTGADGRFLTTMTRTRSKEEGLEFVHIRMESETLQVPPVMILSWKHPAVDIQAFWHPGTDRNKGLQVDWGQGYISKATSLAPVGCLYNVSGYNRLTFALSDALHPMELKAAIHEETSEFHCSISLFVEASSPIRSYEATLRIDTRNIPYYESLDHIQQWWALMPGYTPSTVPDIARLPMYSTWYSFHQRLTPAEVELQCKLAKALGCETIIVDDGWQTSDNARGYAYCGDWEVSPEKFPDMKSHVKDIHEIGMKYILWYSVPFLGKYSRVWSQFSDKLLETIDEHGAGVLDPRFPLVREYIIHTYETALKEWDLDGFKLDFVDSFRIKDESMNVLGNGRDYDSVPEAVDRLLTDVMERLRELKPDIMIEFRQSYIGPLMRKYGNMFRAGDCPNDAIQNRVRTLDIRLLCGNTAAHADMIMWNVHEPVESAALQLINILFSVPQISVLLDKIPQMHLEMARFWLAFWKAKRAVLLDGKLMPHNPELLYPLVIATNGESRIAAVYGDTVVNPGEQVPAEFILINGTLKNRIVLELQEDLGLRKISVLNCHGEIVSICETILRKGLHSVEVPAAGLATFAQ